MVYTFLYPSRFRTPYKKYTNETRETRFLRNTAGYTFSYMKTNEGIRDKGFLYFNRRNTMWEEPLPTRYSKADTTTRQYRRTIVLNVNMKHAIDATPSGKIVNHFRHRHNNLLLLYSMFQDFVSG